MAFVERLRYDGRGSVRSARLVEPKGPYGTSKLLRSRH